MSARQNILKDERGTTLVEFALVIALFLLLFFMLIDFGRLTYNWVTAEKAIQMAARSAAVRPVACAGPVPQTNQRGTDTTPRFGTACTTGANVCQTVDTITCSGVAGDPTVDFIWARIEPLLPGNATEANLRFTYTYDPDMNFLGGPYVPVVTVELQNLQFEFVHPLLGLARVAGANTGAANDTPAAIPFPSMSVSLPGEDLALGTNG